MSTRDRLRAKVILCTPTETFASFFLCLSTLIFLFNSLLECIRIPTIEGGQRRTIHRPPRICCGSANTNNNIHRRTPIRWRTRSELIRVVFDTNSMENNGVPSANHLTDTSVATWPFDRPYAKNISIKSTFTNGLITNMERTSYREKERRPLIRNVTTMTSQSKWLIMMT